MNRLSVSIIIPIYNVEEYIERCARSLYEQTYPHIEYIWINDATPDKSLILLKRITKEYPNRERDVRIIEHSSNLGLPSARKTGISVARGDYILHCDSDDWTNHDMIEKLVACAESEQSDIIWCDFYRTYSDEDVLVKQDFEPSISVCLSNLLSQRMHGGYWNKLIRRELYVKNNIIYSSEASMCEDLLGVIQLFSYAESVSYYPEAFYHYQQDNASALSVTFSPRKIYDIQTNIDLIIRFSQGNPFFDQYSIELNYLKLLSKRSLLTTTDIAYFKQWCGIYPESSKYILSYSALPFTLRFIGWCSYIQLWFPVFVWIWLKKLKNKNTR